MEARHAVYATARQTADGDLAAWDLAMSAAERAVRSSVGNVSRALTDDAVLAAQMRLALRLSALRGAYLRCALEVWRATRKGYGVVAVVDDVVYAYQAED